VIGGEIVKNRQKQNKGFTFLPLSLCFIVLILGGGTG
jgi:hypothetical protein